MEHEDVSGVMITSGICGENCIKKAKEITRASEEKLGLKRKK